MAVATLAADFAYGNTRLRARKGEFLGAAEYERLLGKDVDGVLGALAETPYAPDVEATLARHHGAPALNDAVRRHLARTLEEMRSFYAGPARELIDVLLSRFDVGNLLALLRAKAGGTPPEDALLALVPLGWAEDALAREILRQHELPGAVELIVRWLPDAEQGRVVRAAFAEYERTEDLASLEHALIADHCRRAVERVESAGAGGETLLEYLRREIDEQNLLTVLRLRADLEDRRQDASAHADALPGGSVEPAALADAARLPGRDAVAARLVELGRESWREPLERWAATGDLVLLERELGRALAAGAVRLFLDGDPLAIDVPLAYTVAKQTEARNMRLVAESAVRGRDAGDVRAELVLAGAA